MEKLKKRTPVKVPSDMVRAVQQIYDDLNEIIKAVNSFQLDEVGVQGKSQKLNALLDELSVAEEGECESCAI